MSEIKISLDNIFNKYNSEGISPSLPGMVNLDFFKNPIQMMMLEFGTKLLELAAENAKIHYTYDDLDIGGYQCDKQSILDTIKQVE